MARVVDAAPPKDRLKTLLASVIDPSGDLRGWPALTAVDTAIDLGAPAGTIKALANSAIVLQAGLNVPGEASRLQAQVSRVGC